MGSSLPTTMKAVRTYTSGTTVLETDSALPTIRPGYVLVKVTAVALNPTDWKHVDMPSKDDSGKTQHTGCLVGCDYAGVVAALGTDISKDWKVGDRIAGFVHGVNAVQKDDGAFAEYIVAKADAQMRVPDSMSDEEAATMGVGVNTVGQALYMTLDLPWPGQAETSSTAARTPVLIYGASTATGMFAVQFAKLSGLHVIATCSPRNFDLIKSLGADEVLDYTDEEACIAEIKKSDVHYSMDCISSATSEKIATWSLATDGGASRCCGVLPHQKDVEYPSENITRTWILGYTYLGEAFDFWGQWWEAKPEHWEWAKRFITAVDALLQQQKLKGIRYEVGPAGLEGAREGMDKLRKGEVSGTKLVYRVADTP